MFPKSLGIMFDGTLGSRTLLHGEVSHPFTGNLSNTYLIFNSMKWSYYQKYVNQLTLNISTL